MKIFLTIELFAALSLIIGWWRDVAARHSYHTSDDGWTVSFRYNVKKRQDAYWLSYLSATLAIIGILFLIWS